MGKKDPLKIIGIVIIIISAIILFSGIHIPLQSIAQIGPIIITDIPQTSATRILIGVIGVILGLIIYHGKEWFKIFMK